MTQLISSLILVEGWRRLLLALFAGGLSSLAQAPLGWFPLLWLTIPVFIWLLDSAALGKAPVHAARAMAMVGWTFGFGFFLGTFYWLGHAFLVEADKFAWAMPLAVLVLPAGLALFWALACVPLGWLWSDGPSRIITLALSLSLFEWLRGTILTGLPWGGFGAALASNLWTMQILSLTGVEALTLFSIALFAIPVLIFATDVHRNISRVAAAIIVVLFAGQILFGVIRLNSATPVAEPDKDQPVIRLVQPNIPQSEKWKLENRAWIFNRLLALSSQDTSSSPLADVDLIIWPESAVPFYLIEQPAALAAIGKILPENVELLTGALRRQPQANGEDLVYNAIYRLGSDGTVMAAYDKLHLVPFGEYLPLQSFLESLGLEQLTRLKGGFEPGQIRKAFALSKSGSALPLICYEIAFASEILEQKQRADWIVNVTNDAWFGDSLGPHQHLHLAQMRAVETGLSVIRVANTGISAVIDPHGRPVARLELMEGGILQHSLPRALPETFYARWGTAIFAFLWCFAFVANWFLRRKMQSSFT